MKYLSIPFASIGLVAACGIAQAAEYGTVVSSTAVMAQVAVPVQQCTEQQQLVQPRTSGGGALVGALIGGVVGHNIGSGFGRAAATGVGVVAGAAIGDRTEAANTPSASVPVRNCQTFTSYENRVVAYDVSYDYNGQRHVARLSQAFNPGESIALNVNVSPAGGAMVMASPPPPPVMSGPTVAYTQAPAYGYYGYGGPVFIEQRRHGHWR
jgi:uncharacterized protein YcfJ